MKPPQNRFLNLHCRKAYRGKVVLLLSLVLLTCPVLMAQTRIQSNVYSWKDADVEKTETGSKRSIVSGIATDFELMDISATTLEKDKSEEKTSHPDFEEMIIVKDGSLKITINGEAKTVGRGSVAIVMPDVKHSYSNAADGETTYYVLRYTSRNPVDAERGKKSGGSFLMDWNDVKFNSRSDGKGGRRDFFTRATAMGKRLELHSTLLASGQNSHTPHRHRAEEMVIILDADVEMYLGPDEKDGKTRKATDGDVIFLVSNEYHAISNIGSESALYFAFQFE
jgi:(S)-ureidoglycine aminohydrolase